MGQAEIASSSDNKTAVYALMDKIAFDRERYRLGHTLVFFRAGALAGKSSKYSDKYYSKSLTGTFVNNETISKLTIFKG